MADLVNAKTGVRISVRDELVDALGPGWDKAEAEVVEAEVVEAEAEPEAEVVEAEAEPEAEVVEAEAEPEAEVEKKPARSRTTK